MSIMNGTGQFNARIPQPAVPFQDPSGGISREWLYFMTAILGRTGGNGGISSASLQQQIISTLVTAAFEGETPPAPGVAFTMDSVMSDPAVPTAVNPFIAALLVSDAS